MQRLAQCLGERVLHKTLRPGWADYSWLRPCKCIVKQKHKQSGNCVPSCSNCRNPTLETGIVDDTTRTQHFYYLLFPTMACMPCCCCDRLRSLLMIVSCVVSCCCACTSLRIEKPKRERRKKPAFSFFLFFFLKPLLKKTRRARFLDLFLKSFWRICIPYHRSLYLFLTFNKKFTHIALNKHRKAGRLVYYTFQNI